MSPKRRNALRAAVAGCAGAVAIAGLVASGLPGAAGTGHSGPLRLSSRASERHVVLDGDLRSARRLGPIAPGTTLRVDLALAPRNGQALQRLIDSGHTVSPAGFAARFLPKAGAVHRAVRYLDSQGLAARWTRTASAAQVVGPAGAFERAFGVRIERYRTAGGRAFYAPLGRPRLPAPLRGVFSTVSGLSDFSHVTDAGLVEQGGGSAGCSGSLPGGYRPSQVESAYHFGPLRSAGLDGSGETVVFIEIGQYNPSDLACFAHRFGLPPFHITQAPERWGAPNSDPTEADMDLEIVHALAPAARLVVFNSSAPMTSIAAAMLAAAGDYPKAILSVSLGSCEVEATNSSGTPAVSQVQSLLDQGMKQFAATGGSVFVASGDSGAYICGSQVTNAQGGEAPTVSAPADDPYVTAVGGTTLFIGAGGSYAGEATWGDPFEGSGSGGGVSTIWARPSWQRGPGVSNQNSTGGRQMPDVAALGDGQTGWDIYTGGSWSIWCGTSAAAPLWAALTALTDQALSQHGLPAVGFANPMLYRFGQRARVEPAPPYNDVTRGSNLYYVAGPHWDFGTGWGSPNASGFVDDVLVYREAHK